jgi:hypothetical protein
LISSEISGQPKPHFVYICPLCCNEYILYQNGVWSCSKEFTLDHYPPQNIQGKETILTCCDCNNKAGFSYEPVLEEWFKMNAFNNRIPNSSIKTKNEVEDMHGWYGGELGMNEDGQIYSDINRIQQKKFPNLTNWYARDVSMNITVTDPDKVKMTKALLKTAYLFCFASWGYEFVYSNAGEIIRKVWQGESEYPIPITDIWFDEIRTPEFNKIPRGLVYIHNESSVFGMFVFVPFSSDESTYKGLVPVHIPNPTENWIVELKDFHETFRAGGPINLLITPVNNNLDSFLTLPYSFSWIKINNDVLNGVYNKKSDG